MEQVATSAARAAAVSVTALVDELEGRFEDALVFVHRRTGEVRTEVREYLAAAEDGSEEGFGGWEREAIQGAIEVLEDPDWVRAPDAFDVDEWGIMRDFGASRSDGAASDALLRAIQGRGAFRSFRDQLERLGLREEWSQFRRETLEQIAREWLEVERIPFAG